MITLRPKGNQYGGELGWSAGEERSLALGWFQRADDGGTKLDARALSVRGAFGMRGFTLAGELVTESGTFDQADLEGRGGHLGLTYALERKGEPYAQVEYLLFSGDDPATPEDEGFYPWNYRWTDWSRYYVADLVASTLAVQQRRAHLEARVRLHAAREHGPAAAAPPHRPRHGGQLRRSARRAWGGGFADEADLVVDQGLGGNWSAWVMGGYVRPREAAKALVGESRSGQLFVSLTYKFDSAGGSGD